jgi:hypothetical protein
MLPSRKVSWSEFLAKVRGALADPDAHFFADTSFLMKAASLNGPARAVVRGWVDNIGAARFHVPAWVAHETYRHLGKDNGQALTPMSRLASDLAAKIDEIRAEARRFVDDDSSASFPVPAGTPVPDRAGYLLGLDAEAARLGARARHLRQRAAGRLEDTADFLAELINKHVMPAGTYESLATIEAEYAARLVGDQPPGQKDRKKELNKYGDLLTWREIVDHCKKEPSPNCVILLTDDNKPDWVFRPPMLVDDRGEGRPDRTVSNDGSLGFQVLLPQPLLTHELAGGRDGFQLHIVNLGTLARISADQPEMRDLAHAYSALVAEQQPQPETAPPAAADDEAVQQVSVTPATTSLEQRIADLGDLDRAADAVAALSVELARGELAAPMARATGRAIVEAAESGVETAELFGRAVLSTNAVHPDTRPTLLEGMLLGAYLREDGRLRSRPLTALVPALFEASSKAEARPAVERLRAEIGAEVNKYLLLPGDGGAASLNMALRRRGDGTGKLKSVLRGDVPLLVDGRRGAPTSLAMLANGRTEESVAAFRRMLADHFAVPDGRIETNLALADRVSWDEIQCLVDWGADTERPLR